MKVMQVVEMTKRKMVHLWGCEENKGFYKDNWPEFKTKSLQNAAVIIFVFGLVSMSAHCNIS